MAVVTPQTTTISMEVAQEAQRHVPILVAALPRTIMTSMVAASVRQQHAPTMAVEPPRHITTPMATVLVQVIAQVQTTDGDRLLIQPE